MSKLPLSLIRLEQMKNVNKTLFIFTLVILLIGFILYYQGKPILDTLIRTDLSIAIWIIFLTIPYIAMGGL